MIRNVVMGQLSPTATEDQRSQLQKGLDGIAGLKLPGLLAMHLGGDVGLREGGWTFAITNDWVDADAYRNYDTDAEHNKYRALIVEVCEQLARVQFEIAQSQIPTLYQWAGGADAIERLVDTFYDLTIKDELLAPLFANMSPQHRHYVALWIGEVLGGPAEYSAVRGERTAHPYMVHKHLSMALTAEHRERWLALMRQAADDVQLPTDPEFRSALFAYFEWGTRMNDVFHEGSPVPKHADMPIWGWGERQPYVPDSE